MISHINQYDCSNSQNKMVLGHVYTKGIMPWLLVAIDTLFFGWEYREANGL